MTAIRVSVDEQSRNGLPDRVMSSCLVVWHGHANSMSDKADWSVLVPYQELDFYPATYWIKTDGQLLSGYEFLR